MNISVYKDQYVVRFYYKRKDGSTKYVSMTEKDWKTDRIKKANFKILASQAMVEKIRELDREQEKTSQERQTLEFYIDKFLGFDETMSRGTTTENKRIRLKNYVGAYFGIGTPVRKIFTTKNMMDFRIYVASLNRSNDTSSHVFSTTKQFIDYLVAQKAIDGAESVAMKASLVPLRKRDEEAVDGEEDVGENFWTKAEIDKFFTTFEKDDLYKFLFYISFWCATRIGETLGLKFSDFDSTSSTVSILRSRNNHARIGATKTASSKARITIPKHVFQHLAEYRLLSKATSDDDYLFFPTCHASRTTIRRVLATHADMAELHHITPHGFRHSMASYLLANGFDYMDVCKYLRHASPDITLKVYSHWIQKKNAKGFDELAE